MTLTETTPAAARMDAMPTRNIAHALSVLQTRLPEIKKSQTAEVPTKAGGRYTYTYADLAEVTRALMPILGELGLAFTARPTTTEDGRFVLAYSLMHVSGESLDGEYPLRGDSPQTQGSAITYARRYCLCALTGVAPEDDDDDAARIEAERQRYQQEAQGQRSAWRAPAPGRGPNGAGKARQPQLQKLHVLFGKANWKDRAECLRAMSAITGRPLSSSTELTIAEASKVIDALQKVLKTQDPEVELERLVVQAEERSES